MKIASAIFMNEWRRHKKWVAFLFSIVFVTGIAAFFRSNDTGSVTVLISISMTATLIGLSFMYSNSITSEWQGGHNHLILCLPINPAKYFLYKYLFFAMSGVIIVLIFTFWISISDAKDTSLTTTLTGGSHYVLWKMVSLYYLTTLNLFLGILTFAHGLSTGRKTLRRTILLAVMFFSVFVIVFLGQELIGDGIESQLESISISSPGADLKDVAFDVEYFYYVTVLGALGVTLGLISFKSRMSI